MTTAKGDVAQEPAMVRPLPLGVCAHNVACNWCLATSIAVFIAHLFAVASRFFL